MTESAGRRLTDRSVVSPTFIGAGTRFTGKLECGGDLMVNGSAMGESVVQGTFTLAESGRWEGMVEAKIAVLAGDIEGTIVVQERLEIHKTARIRGVVKAATIAIARGAVIEGEMITFSGAPVMSYEEKRG
jgi:cytoskeletal protein CcmA (bactofilin family)